MNQWFPPQGAMNNDILHVAPIYLHSVTLAGIPLAEYISLKKTPSLKAVEYSVLTFFRSVSNSFFRTLIMGRDHSKSFISHTIPMFNL